MRFVCIYLMQMFVYHLLSVSSLFDKRLYYCRPLFIFQIDIQTILPGEQWSMNMLSLGTLQVSGRVWQSDYTRVACM